MATPRNSYQHFCPAARALEVIGGKWSLLIVRDLLAGPRRFSDLRRTLTDITPKWLSARLQALESDGVVERQTSGQRDVWYRLTPKGQALESIIDALIVWGLDHALGKPRAREVVHPGRATESVRRYLEHRHVRPPRPTTWVLRFAPDRSYTLRFDGERWSRQRGETPADLVIQTSPEGWVRFLSADRAGRERWLERSRVAGTAKSAKAFASAFERPLA
jgi:DNA-binding HxlR family transcriptional regulator